MEEKTPEKCSTIYGSADNSSSTEEDWNQTFR